MVIHRLFLVKHLHLLYYLDNNISISFLTKPNTAFITHQNHPPSMIISKFMNSKLFIIPTIIIIFNTTIQTCHGQSEEQYYDCMNNYTCGQVAGNVSYPFWGGDRPQYCGHPAYELKCQNDDYPTLNMGNSDFRVLRINQSIHQISIARLDLWKSYCTEDFSSVTFPSAFRYNEMVRRLFIFYNCTPEMTRAFPNFTCNVDGRESGGFYANQSLVEEGERLNSMTISCSQRIAVPVIEEALIKLLSKTLSLQEALKMGFEVQYDAENTDCSRCEGSGGNCGSDSSGFMCHCRDGPGDRTCSNPGDQLNWGKKFAIVFGTAGFTIAAMVLIYFIYRRCRKRRYAASSCISRNISSHPSSMTDLENAVTIYGVRILKYSELEKATNYFDSNKELGDGGFGTVYQGKLRDGRVVAVKRLYEHNYNRVEQFMNEIEILARLRHPNLVSLYGCTSRHCRELLLVYEYIPNGTVADHLHGEQAKPGSLSWNTRMSIAIQTASALSYLHASDVIHRDVKTNNILLDNNFCVKVADFGLSRHFPNDVTHVSTAPQGTAGYVDPEYHECYQLTNKSDVYSFGVVLIELISSKPAVDITRHRHEINLSNMAINKIQNHALHELVDPFLGFESDSKVRNTITDVAELAFQCLQSERDMRPSMEKVLENLKRIQGENGNTENIEEVEIPADEVVLLKSDPPPLSPDSVNVNWICRETTPIASS